MSIRQGNRIIANHTIVDEGLNSASANPVQNSAITGAINSLNSTLSTKANDSNVVHKSGNETITGQKIFAAPNVNNNLIIRNTSADRTTIPTANMDSIIGFQDANSAHIGRILSRHNTDGTTQFSIIPECSLSSAGYQAWFSFINTGTGGYMLLPGNPISTNSQSSSRAASMGWVNAPSLSTNVVHRSDYEEITGIKTFTQRSQYRLPVTKGTAPSSNQRREIVFTDQRQTSGTWTTANNIAGLQFYYLASKGTRADLVAYQGANATDDTSERISIGYTPSNAVYTYCPASAAVNSIVTTTGISKASNGYVKLGNGIIIQWGRAQINTDGQTVTLPTAFSNTNYSVAGAGGDHAYGNTCAYNRTTSSFQAWLSDDASFNTGTMLYIAIGY